MLKRLPFAVALALILTVAAPTHAAPDPKVEARYAQALAAAKAGPPDAVDWQAFRFAYADSAEFDPEGIKVEDAKKAMFAALNAHDAAQAIAQAGKVLADNFADIDAHIVLDLAYAQTGAAADEAREHATVLAILRSIRTGDGASPAQAFTVISVGEEYQVMRAFVMTVQGQALVEADGHSYDRLSVVDGEGKAHTFFFLVDRVLAAEAAGLGLPKH